MSNKPKHINVLEDQYAEIEAFLNNFRNYPQRISHNHPKDLKRWLREYLFNRGGSAPAADVTRAAEECGIDINDLNALVHCINKTFVMSYPEGPQSRCWWVLKS